MFGKLIKETPDKQITIDGKFLTNYNAIKIEQFLYKHHRFEIVLDLEAIEKKGSHTLENAKNWLGKKMATDVTGRAFQGIILDISLEHKNGGLDGLIFLRGLSESVLLDSAIKKRSWLNRDLKSVVNEITNDFEKKAINIKENIKVPYLCQYDETNYNYLQRLAHQYNQWFYFDGLTLLFGKPDTNDTKPLALQYDTDLTDIDIKIKTFKPTIASYMYDPIKDNFFEAEQTTNNQGLNELALTALKASKTIYAKAKDYTVVEPFLQDKSSLDNYLLNQTKAINSDANILTAKSRKKGLQIGTKITVSAAKKDFKELLVQHYGEYIITEITHTKDTKDGYRNEFKAIPANVACLPINQQIKPITTSTQIAKVVSNNDPQQKGRVQVQFLWQQANGEKTDFIRVITPDAGNSETVTHNRGFVFIPEKGDQVMVGFENNNPNRPYVMGSLFTGKTAQGGGTQNNAKSIITKSGNTILMDDKTGSITVSDASGNHIKMNGNGEMLVYAPNKLTFASNDINLIANNTINLTAKPNTQEKAQGDGIVNILAQKSIHCNTQQDNFSIVAAKNISIESKEEAININGKTTIDLLSSDKMNLSGKEITSSATKNNKVVGGKVEINKG